MASGEPSRGFAEVRAAARACSQKSRLANALSIAANEVRVALAAGLLSADRSTLGITVLTREDEAARLDTIASAQRLHFLARAVLSDCSGPMDTEWHMSGG
jgi:hypothetical protein